MRFLIVLALGLSVACGGQIYLHPTNYCSLPVGSYAIHWTTLGGNCGDVPDQVISTYDLDAQLGESTINSQQWSADNCTEYLDYVRTDPSTGEVVHWVDTIACQDQDCTAVSEQMSITATWGSQSCSGTYQIDWVKQ